MSNVVSSQPRTAAKINSTEPAFRYDANCEECRNDDQCCFVYFYTLYCGRCRCSGCCDDKTQKSRRPQRRMANNYTRHDVYDDDNVTSFINDDNVYRPTTYTDYNIVNERTEGYRGDLVVAGINYDSSHSGNRGYTRNIGQSSGQKHNEGNSDSKPSGVHSGTSEAECFPYGQPADHGSKSHSGYLEDRLENVCYTVDPKASGGHDVSYSGGHFGRAGYSAINSDSAINSETVCYPYGHGNKSHSGDSSGFENKAENVCYTVSHNESRDHSVSHSGGKFEHEGHSNMNNDSHTHWSSGDHSGGNRGNEDHSSGWSGSGGDTGGDSGGGGGDSGGGGGDSGGGGCDSGGGGESGGGDSGGGGGGGDD